MSSDRARRRLAVAVLAGILAVGGIPASTRAKVFYARDEAFPLAFPQADRTEVRNFYLTPAQRAEIQARAKASLDSSLVTIYVVHRGDELLGYAIFDTHVVRTLPETFLVVLTPDGKIMATHVLAFYEPLEYLPSDRWLALFRDRKLGDDLQVGRGIAAITGSTLTARAVTDGIRRALAMYAVLLEGK